jgi:ethanolamine utilization cobalamin adenosyltransferase
MKKIENVVKDVYNLLDTKEVSEYVDQEAIINTFGENMKKILRQNLKEYRGGTNLRMSNIGKKDRQLWYQRIRGRAIKGTHEINVFIWICYRRDVISLG